MTLHVPLVTDEDDPLGAALKYAATGWYVLPVSPRDRKNPGSVVGKGWQHQSSRDPQQIAAWFAGTDYLLALHVGRSGGVVFDVDDPDRIPDLLAAHLHGPLCPPHQSSRPDQPGRGHYAFLQPRGRTIGNSTGRLGKGWGEVRGKNGVIIAAPSRHAREDDGARYEWLGTGDVPTLPAELAELLPDSGATTDAASDEEVRRFIATYTDGRAPGKLQGPVKKYADLLEEGGSRHQELVSVACWAMREVVAGWYPAAAAIDALNEAFVEAAAIRRKPTDRVLDRTQAEAEADGVFAWAIAQAEAESIKSTGKTLPTVEMHATENDRQNRQNPGPKAAPGGSGSSVGQNPGEWDPFTPLPGRCDPLPVEALGKVLQPLVEEIGKALQVPTDLPTNLALPLITTAAAGRWVVEVDAGWQEALCLTTLSALPSGEMKTPTLKVLDAALRDFERDIQRAAAPERSRKLATKKLAEERVTEARKVAVKKPAGGMEEKKYLAAVEHLDTIDVPALPRLLADDATPEAVVSLLAEHRAIGVVSDEPGLFGILAGRYSNGTPQIEWFLKATSGSPIKVDRKGRDAEDVMNPALSAACCIQPGRLVELGTVKAFRDSGFLARWLFSIPSSSVGTRGATRPVAPGPVDHWSSHLVDLAEAAQKYQGAEPQVLRIDDAGRAALKALRAELEPDLHPDHGRYAGIADWCNKLVGTTARIAAALTLLADPASTVVAAETVADAVRLGRAYVSHAIAAFGLTRPNGETFSRARQVLGTIRKLADHEGRVTERDVHRKLADRAWVENAETLQPLLELLAEFGHIRRHDGKRPAGGRPSPFVELHPDHLADRKDQA